MKLPSFLTSSTDPEKLSLTVRGFLISIIPLLMMFTGLSEADITPLVDGIVTLVFALTSLIAAVQMVYGLARKVYLQRWSAK